MPQTTGGYSIADADMDYAPDGSTWTPIEGFAVEVTEVAQTRKTGEVYTYDGDTAILTAGKREPVELEVKIVATEGAAEIFELIRIRFEGRLPAYFRWAPRGAVSTFFRFTTVAGQVANFVYPTAPAEEAKPVLAGFTIRAPGITKAVIP